MERIAISNFLFSLIYRFEFNKKDQICQLIIMILFSLGEGLLA